MTSERVRRQARVSGRVQGVFFRDSTRSEAELHGVAGWARNCSDGSVEVLLEGARDAVAAVIAFLREGPPRASVDAVEVSDAGDPEGLGGFEIR